MARFPNLAGARYWASGAGLNSHLEKPVTRGFGLLSCLANPQSERSLAHT
jgi:hypothetical protein